MSEVGKQNGNFGVFQNEMPIKIGEAQEGLGSLIFQGLGQS